MCPLIGGTLKTVCVRDGARVKKGQPLFIIDQAPYIAAVNVSQYLGYLIGNDSFSCDVEPMSVLKAKTQVMVYPLPRSMTL